MTQEFFFVDMKRNKPLEDAAKEMFISVANAGLRGRNNIEFTCNIYDPENKSTGIMNSDIYRDWETDRKSTRLNSSHRL